MMAMSYMIPSPFCTVGSMVGGVAESPVVPPVVPVPENTVAPALDNTAPGIGDTITCGTGTWTNTPTSYAYQWKRDGANIGGAASNSYLVDAADEGAVLTCAVTASNAGGAGSPATSDATDPIPGSFVPTDIAGIQYYGKVSTLGLSDDDPIGSLTQLSAGSGSDATATLTNRPTFKAAVAAFGNKDVARFNVTNRLTGTVTVGGTSAWAFLVLSMESATNTNGRILSLGDQGQADWASASFFAITRRGSGEAVSCIRNTVEPSGGGVTYSQPCIVIVRYDGTDVFLSVDGGAESSASSSGTFAIEDFRIGDYVGNDSYGSAFAGDIAEVAFGTGDLSPTDISNLVSYAQTEYGL